MSRTIATIFYVIFGAIGGLVLPIGALMLLSVFLPWLHNDPAAGGVLSFLVVPIAPFGIAVGIALGMLRVNQIYDSKKQIPSASEKLVDKESTYNPFSDIDCK